MNDTGIDLYDGIEMTGLSTTNSTLDLYDGIDVAGLNTTNSTLDGQEINPFYFFEFHFIVLWILFFSIVIGNTAVLAALFMNHARKSSRTKYFIMQLAIADLLVGVISVSSDIVGKVKVVWEAGLVACKVMKFSQAFVTYYSTYVLVALSIDRFDAITRPMNFRGSWRRAHLLIMFSWTLSVIFSLPLSYFYEVSVIKGKLQCWIDMPPWQWKIYMSLVALTIFFIPAVIIALCYVFIVRTIWSKSQILSPTRLDNGKGHEDHDIRRSSSRGIIPQAKIKTVKMTFVIVFVFILCWSPYIIYDLLQVYGFLPESQTSQTGVAIATFIQSLAPLNSAANPVIYCLFSTHICNSLSKIPPFSWFFCCGHENQEPSICTETTSSASRSRSLSHFRGSSTRPRPKTNNHCYESNHHDALL